MFSSGNFLLRIFALEGFVKALMKPLRAKIWSKKFPLENMLGLCYTFSTWHHTKSLKHSLQTHERFKKMLIIKTKHNLHSFGGIPFIKLQNDRVFNLLYIPKPLCYFSCTAWKKCWPRYVAGMKLSAAPSPPSTSSSFSVSWGLGQASDQVRTPQPPRAQGNENCCWHPS